VADGLAHGVRPLRAHLPPPGPVVEPGVPGAPTPEPDDEDDQLVPPGSGEPPVDLPSRETPGSADARGLTTRAS
jgi:hypothetical protein